MAKTYILSQMKFIGSVELEVFNRCKINHITDLNKINKLLQYQKIKLAISDLKTENPDYPLSHWMSLNNRCIKIVNRLVNSKAMPVEPYYLICPISLQLMNDPVIAPSGISYERGEIEDWLIANNNTEPITKQSLTIEQLYTNINLKQAIDYYRNNYMLFENSYFDER